MRKLAGSHSVMLNVNVNLLEDEAVSYPIAVAYRGKVYDAMIGKAPAIEVRKGALVAGCTFRQLPAEGQKRMPVEAKILSSCCPIFGRNFPPGLVP